MRKSGYWLLSFFMAAGLRGQDVSREALALLGSTAGQPQNGGAVFVDGRYVAPPYTVSRQGNALFINRYLVQESPEWETLATANRSKGKFLDEDGDFEIVPEGGVAAAGEVKAKVAALVQKIDAARARHEQALMAGQALFFLKDGRALATPARETQKLLRVLPDALAKASDAKALKARLEADGVYGIDPDTLKGLLRHPLNERTLREAATQARP